MVGVGYKERIVKCYLVVNAKLLGMVVLAAEGQGWLFRLQKKILRAMQFQPFSAPSSPIFLSLKLLKLQDVLHTNILTFVYKALNKLSPPFFHDYFHPNSAVHRIGTRQATRGDLFSALKNTTLYGLQTIQYFCSKL